MLSYKQDNETCSSLLPRELTQLIVLIVPCEIIIFLRKAMYVKTGLTFTGVKCEFK